MLKMVRSYTVDVDFCIIFAAATVDRSRQMSSDSGILQHVTLENFFEKRTSFH